MTHGYTQIIQITSNVQVLIKALPFLKQHRDFLLQQILVFDFMRTNEKKQTTYINYQVAAARRVVSS